MGLAALLASPAAWSSTALMVPAMSVLPAADPSILEAGAGLGGGPPGADPETVGSLAEFLVEHRGSERWALATPNIQLAAPIIIATGLPVMAMGGFLGSEPAITPESLASMAASGQIRYVMTGGGGPGFGPGGGPDGSARVVAAWVRKKGSLVDPKLWRPARPEGGDDARSPERMMRRMMGAGMKLYDLRPEPKPGGGAPL